MTGVALTLLNCGFTLLFSVLASQIMALGLPAAVNL